MSNKALLIIDWENEWINPDSEYYIGSDLSAETENMNKLIAYSKGIGIKVIFIKHIELEGEAFNGNNTSTDLIKGLDVSEDDVVVEKNKISSFYKTRLEDELEEIDGIIIAGILTNLCVRSAVQDAYDRDYGVTIVKDCSVSFDQDTQDFTLKDLQETRPEVEIVNLEEFIN